MGILKKKNEEGTEAKVTELQPMTAGEAYKVLLHPVLSEKSTREEQLGKYTFLVDMNSNKIEVKKAIKSLYGVWPKSVNISITEGKKKRFGRIFGRRKSYKKAIVTVKKGDKLDVHAGL